MSFRVQSHPETPPHGIYHQGLIKKLIVDQLKEKGRSWDHFIFWGGFKSENQSSNQKKNETPRKKIKTLTQQEVPSNELLPVTPSTPIVTRSLKNRVSSKLRESSNLVSSLKVVYTRTKRISIAKGERPELPNEDPKHSESDEGENPDENANSTRMSKKKDEKNAVQWLRIPITNNANKFRLK